MHLRQDRRDGLQGGVVPGPGGREKHVIKAQRGQFPDVLGQRSQAGPPVLTAGGRAADDAGGPGL